MKNYSTQQFAGKVDIYFSGSNNREIILPAMENFGLPSEIKANKIRELIKRKKTLPKQSSYSVPVQSLSALPSFAVHKEESIEQLEKELKHLEEYYSEDDMYEIFELHSHKLNIIILNNGDEYIEDATLQVDVDKFNGLFIAEKIYNKPKPPTDYSFSPSILDFGRYPEIEDCGSYVRIYNSTMRGRLGKWDIKHQMPVEAFLEPVRVAIMENLAGDTIPLKCKLYGKNLKSPIEETLRIKVAINNKVSKTSSAESTSKI